MFGELSDSANLNRMYYGIVLEEESSAHIGYEPVNTDTATMWEWRCTGKNVVRGDVGGGWTRMAQSLRLSDY